MPHAGGTAEVEQDENSGPTLTERAGKLAETARAHPRTAAAAGAAVLAGAVVAAAIPLVRARRRNQEGQAKSSKGSKKAR